MPTPILNFFRPAMRGLSRAYFGLSFQGVENIPPAGPLLITPNHQTYADPPLVTIPIRRAVHYMAWSRLFEVPLFGWWIRHLRAFPVDVATSDARAIRAAITLLRAGEILMIFPEGQRSLDGGLQPFKVGAFRLAVSLKVPVLPVTIAGGHESWPPSRVLPRPGRMTITYHPVLQPDPTRPAREAARALADEARALIARAL